MSKDPSSVELRVSKLEARIKELEAALREIAEENWRRDGPPAAIARAALDKDKA